MTNEDKLGLLSEQPDQEAHEPSLSELREDLRRAEKAYNTAYYQTTMAKRGRQFVYGVAILLALYFSVSFFLPFPEAGANEKARVPLEIHVMSKCPDARDCLHDMILPAMMKVEDKVDFQLSFIGTTTDHDDGVECKHGQEECLGNLIELCAAHAYPDPKIYLGFAMCLSKDYTLIPQRNLIESCALEHGISMDRLNQCTMDDQGDLSVGLLKDSFERSLEANVTKSCTVRLGGEVRCIHDGGKWYDCPGGSEAEDLVRDVKALYEKN